MILKIRDGVLNGKVFNIATVCQRYILLGGKLYQDYFVKK